MSAERDPAVLLDIANACQLLLEFTKDRNRSEFDSDLVLQSAVLHQLLVLGEAVRRLREDFRANRPEIPWVGYVGLRNVLIHQYDVVDLDEVWRVATEDVPKLRRQLADLLLDESQ